MPLRKYIILKKAVEIESIALRRLMVYDIAHAFNNAKPLLQQLDKDYFSLVNEKKKGSGLVNWGKDSDWKERLQKFNIKVND